MAQTYSTLRRDAANGRVYSSQYSTVTPMRPLRRESGLGQALAAVAEAPAAPVAPPVAAVPAPLAAPAAPAAPPADAVPAPAVPAPLANLADPAPAYPAPAPLANLAAPAPAYRAPTPSYVPPAPAFAGPPSAQVPPTLGPAVLKAAAAIAQNLGLPQLVPAPGPAQWPAGGPSQSATFSLSTQGLPPATLIAPGGASGTVTVSAHPGEAGVVSGSVQGVRPLTDPALRPISWLIHDLTVPHDLTPADLATLPRGSAGSGNQPGGVFTIDGNAPTYTPACNTVSVCISPGSFNLQGDGSWKLDGTIDSGTNLAFHPLAFLGPGALADSNAPLPSGTAARILTDLFMRPATVHRELNLRTQFPQRLMAVARDVLGSTAEPAFLAPEQFTRAAVTVEGLVRSTPTLMPSRETTFLLANSPTPG